MASFLDDIHPEPSPIELSVGPSTEEKLKITEAFYTSEHGLPLNLTLGVEFEALFGLYRPWDQGNKNKEKDWYGEKNEAGENVWDARKAYGKFIVQRTLAEPVQIECTKCGHTHQFQVPLRDYDDPTTDFDTWLVSDELSVEYEPDELAALGGDRNDYAFYSVEFKTRILTRNQALSTINPSHEHVRHVAYDQEIAAVLNAINAKFCNLNDGAKRKECMLFITPNCGLHVHIANGKDSPLPFSTIKKIFAVHAACERQIDGLHAISRITGTDVGIKPVDLGKPVHPYKDGLSIVPENHVYNKPMSWYLIVAAQTRRRWYHDCEPGQKPTAHDSNPSDYPETFHDNPKIRYASVGLDVDSWITLAKEAPNVKSLRELLHGNNSDCTLHLAELPQHVFDYDEIVSKKYTIEFRQHVGTVDPRSVLAYVDFLASLVTFCHSTEDDELYKLMSVGGKFRAASFDTLALCKAIGCGTATISHYQRQLDSQSDYLPKRLDKAEDDAIQAEKRGDGIGEVAKAFVNWQRDDLNPDSIKKFITKKLRRGGYGQFDSDTLQALLPNCGKKTYELLTIGYTSPVIGTPMPKSGITLTLSSSKLAAWVDPEDMAKIHAARTAELADILSGAEDEEPGAVLGHLDERIGPDSWTGFQVRSSLNSTLRRARSSMSSGYWDGEDEEDHSSRTQDISPLQHEHNVMSNLCSTLGSALDAMTSKERCAHDEDHAHGAP